MKVIKDIEERLGVKLSLTTDKHGEHWIEVDASKLVDVARIILENGFDHLTTITGVDTGEKIILFYHLVKFEENKAVILNIKVQLDRDNPIAPSLVELYPTAYVYEREVYDLLGVKFEGHPNLKRLLLPEDIPEGIHPLRKDFKLELLER